jgi:hypothetical protein
VVCIFNVGHLYTLKSSYISFYIHPPIGSMHRIHGLIVNIVYSTLLAHQNQEVISNPSSQHIQAQNVPLRPLGSYQHEGDCEMMPIYLTLHFVNNINNSIHSL